MSAAAFGSVEMEMLWLSIVLGIVQLLLATLFSVGARGLPWGVGARDSAAPPLGTFGGRIERAFRNFLETFVFFAAAVLIANALGKHTATSALGAQIFFWSRVAYVPAYAFGIPFVRTLIWVASLAGIGMVMRGIWPGM
ncbi:MAG TPA: MAPEG family protein [Rhizomicrobium sp.]